MLSSLMQRLSPAGGPALLTTLIFHRVVPEVDPLFPDETDAARFDAICSWVASWFNVIPLDDAVRRLSRGELPARALAITFDDGYADNFDIALPILLRHRLPATFFISTGFLDGGRMWNDTVIESVRQCRASVLNLSGLGLGHLPPTLEMSDWGSKRRAIDGIIGAIKYLPVPERSAVADLISQRAGATPPQHLMMRSDQVKAMRGRGMQIGAHTVSHPILATLPDDAALSEIVDSKRRLEAILDEPVELFAYPNGRPGRDFNDRTVQLARTAGFVAAVTTAVGAADRHTDPFRIPRLTPWDRSRWRFGARLARNLWTAGRSAASAAA